MKINKKYFGIIVHVPCCRVSRVRAGLGQGSVCVKYKIHIPTSPPSKGGQGKMAYKTSRNNCPFPM